MTTRIKPRSTNGATKQPAPPKPAAPLSPEETRLARAWMDREKREREWSLYTGDVFDPGFIASEQPDKELFNDVPHPLGTLDFWANSGVTAHVSLSEAWLEVRIARNVSGCDSLTLQIEASEVIQTTDSVNSDINLLLSVTPEALVALAAVLPRATEMARRQGLLERKPVGDAGA